MALSCARTRRTHARNQVNSRGASSSDSARGSSLRAGAHVDGGGNDGGSSYRRLVPIPVKDRTADQAWRDAFAVDEAKDFGQVVGPASPQPQLEALRRMTHGLERGLTGAESVDALMVDAADGPQQARRLVEALKCRVTQAARHGLGVHDPRRLLLAPRLRQQDGGCNHRPCDGADASFVHPDGYPTRGARQQLMMSGGSGRVHEQRHAVEEQRESGHDWIDSVFTDITGCEYR